MLLNVLLWGCVTVDLNCETDWIENIEERGIYWSCPFGAAKPYKKPSFTQCEDTAWNCIRGAQFDDEPIHPAH